MLKARLRWSFVWIKDDKSRKKLQGIRSVSSAPVAPAADRRTCSIFIDTNLQPQTSQLLRPSPQQKPFILATVKSLLFSRTVALILFWDLWQIISLNLRSFRQEYRKLLKLSEIICQWNERQFALGENSQIIWRLLLSLSPKVSKTKIKDTF